MRMTLQYKATQYTTYFADGKAIQENLLQIEGNQIEKGTGKIECWSLPYGARLAVHTGRCQERAAGRWLPQAAGE